MTINEILQIYDNALRTDNDDEIKRGLRLIAEATNGLSFKDAGAIHRRVSQVGKKYPPKNGRAYDTGYTTEEAR